MISRICFGKAIPKSYLRSLRKGSRATFSSSAYRCSYEDTLPNLKLTANTRIIVQGFTGKQATIDSEQSLAYGTKIVGGVRPGKEGEHLGLPYYPSVKAVCSPKIRHMAKVFIEF